MKKMIGKQNILYPMPVTVVAALVKGKVNFINIAHVGILNASQPHLITLGMGKSHYTNQGIIENKSFSVNLMSESEMVAADYVGLASGHKVDKSSVFEVFYGELKTAPIIKNCALSMECKLYDIYDAKTHDVFIGEVVATYAEESVLTNGKIDLSKVKPVLFDMNSVKYWSLGNEAGDCWNIGKSYEA